MGGSSWSDKTYHDRAATRAATKTPVFAYTAAVNAGTAPRAVHAKLNPLGITRESRDSAAHPESLAIGVWFDVTGSMGQIPITLQKKLAGLMNLLIQKGYVAHPQILFGGIGDATCDKGPLQVGQFESGLEMEDDLSLLWLEGGGGGQQTETYELAHYFFAKHTAIDCWEKRGQKGYLFTIGDEAPYDVVRKAHVKDLIGDTIQADLPTKEVIRLAQERYHVFHIIAEQGSYPHDKTIEQAWRDLLGQHVLKLEDAANVAELIAMTIGLSEGTVDIDKAGTDLAEIGADQGVIDSVTAAVVPYISASALTKAGTASGLGAASDATVDRL